MPPEKAEEIMARLEENIQRKVVLEILDLLSPKDQQKVQSFIDDNKKISAFLSKKILNLDSLVKTIAKSAAKDFKNFTK